jgi:hypothetical protein
MTPEETALTLGEVIRPYITALLFLSGTEKTGYEVTNNATAGSYTIAEWPRACTCRSNCNERRLTGPSVTHQFDMLRFGL